MSSESEVEQLRAEIDRLRAKYEPESMDLVERLSRLGRVLVPFEDADTCARGAAEVYRLRLEADELRRDNKTLVAEIECKNREILLLTESRAQPIAEIARLREELYAANLRNRSLRARGPRKS